MNALYEAISLLPFDWAQYGFMQHALVAVVLVTPLLALLGCLVVNNQMAFFSEALGHSALTGLAIGTLLGMQAPLVAVAGFAMILALVMSLIRRLSAVPPDTAVALVMSFIVALGVVLLSHGGGFSRYARYLIGDILTITPGELLGLGFLLLVVAVLWGACFNAFFLIGLNRSLAASRGFPVGWLEPLFAVVVAAVVALAVPWVGLLVINSMLILPAATARNLSWNTRSYVLGALIVGLLSGILGLVSSFYWDSATGATIVLWASGFFALSLLLRRR